MTGSSVEKYRAKWLAICVIATALATNISTLAAQETIFDPENPAFSDEVSEEDDDGADEADRRGQSQIIVDPENPAFDVPPDDIRPSPQPAAPVFGNTEWRLDYELGTLVDPGWGPRGRDSLEILGGLGMRLRHDVSEQTRVVVAGRFSYWAGAGRRFDDWRTLYEPRLDRAYLVHRPGRWSLAFGQMRNSWGSTDIVRPGDVIDPVDMRNPATSDGLGAALAQLSATAGYSGRDWSLRAVLVPFFHGNRMALFGRDTALANERNPIVADQLPFLLLAEELIHPSNQEQIQPFLQATQRPMDLPINASGGLRGTWTVERTDLGLGVFYGWDRTPWVTLDEDMRELLVIIAEDGQVFEDYDFIAFTGRNPEIIEISRRLSQKAEEGETLFSSEFRRRTTVLADFARYLGPIGVRGDVAFSPRRVFYTTDFEPVWRASVFSALGLSYERLLDGVRPLALTLEGFWLHPFSADSAIHRLMVPEEDGGGAEDELLLFDDGYYGVAAAATWHTGWWELEIQGGGMATIAPGDVIARVSISRPWRPGIRTTIGANLFFGPDPGEVLTLGGLWAHNDRIHLAIGGQF